MDALMIYLSSTVAMLAVMIFSIYMLGNSRGKLSDGFKIIILGSAPLLLLRMAQAAMMAFGPGYDVSDLRLALVEQIAQVITALSIFMAIYLIKRDFFGNKAGDGKNG